MQLSAESQRFPLGSGLLITELAQISRHAQRHEILVLIGEYNREPVYRADREGFKGDPDHHLILHCTGYEASRVCDLEGSVEGSH